MDVSALKVKRGDNILSAWKRLLEWAESLRVIPTPGVRLLVTPQGTHVYAEDNSTAWPCFFKVRVTGMDATISPGTVNNRTPAIGGVLLDGLKFGDEDGEPGAAPVLTLKGTQAGRTWLTVRVVVKDGVIDPQDKDALTVAEIQTLNAKLSEGGAPDVGGVAYWPIATLYWRKGVLDRVRQSVRLNLAHRFQAPPNGGGEAGRHFFAAA